MTVSHSETLQKIAAGQFACRVCGRVHDEPREGGPPVICPCGWWYDFVDGRILGHFHDPF
ncbi:MAG TPA: hypothetical protein VNJ51_09280 [Candidatus Dormibacteraeota bacterium]|nr:hypothetical protein [Candidatus Dormibacteraeota bacterium]